MNADKDKINIYEDAYAYFSFGKTCRYELVRSWGDDHFNSIIFIGANPSTAGGKHDDPTIRRLVNFAKLWGYDKMAMLNVNPVISADPKKIKATSEPVLNENKIQLQAYLENATRDVCICWGDLPKKKDSDYVLHYLDYAYENTKGKIFHLGLTKKGNPKHPLYLKANTKRIYELPQIKFTRVKK